MNKVRSLEEILHRCAVLRCVANLQHRTLHEFDWFISACIWGEDGSYGEEGTEVYRIYSDRTSFRLDSDIGLIQNTNLVSLVKFLKLFAFLLSNHPTS